MASMTFLYKFYINNLVPFINIGGLKFLIKIIGHPFFNFNLWDGKPDNSIEFKNSTGNVVALLSSIVSIDVKVYKSPGIFDNNISFMSWTNIFVGAKIHLSLIYSLF